MVFSAYSQFDAVHRQTEVVDPLDSGANVGYDPVGSLDGHQDPEGHLMYFTWAAVHRQSAARCNLANYDVCGNAYGVT